MPVRAYRHQDRGAVLALLGDARALDSPSARVQVEDADGVQAAALWVRPDAGDEPYLASVIVPGKDGPTTPSLSGPAERWRLAYRLAAGCVAEALAQGFQRGHLIVESEALRRHIERAFSFRIEPAGQDPRTGAPRRWRIEVELREALAQLHRVM